MANPVDAIVAGEALVDRGILAFNTISGLGLITEGFLWDCGNIWQPAFPPITTTWTTFSEPTASLETCLDIY